MSATIEFAREDGVGSIRLTRPEKRNALSREMLAALAVAIEQAARSRDVGVVLVEAEGPVFSAGMDLRGIALDDATAWAQLGAALSAVYHALLTLEKPLVCAVDGPALGGGVGIAAAADIVLCGDAASFALPEPRLGLVPALVSVVLRRRLAPKRLAGLVVSGRRLSAREAVALGLADEALDSEAGPVAADRARTIAAECSTRALRATKAFLAEDSLATLDDELARAERAIAVALASPAARRGIEAYRRGESPAWKLREDDER